MFTCEISTALSVSSPPAISASATSDARRGGIETGPIRSRPTALIASEVSENRMIAMAREIRMNFACTIRNSASAKAMMPRSTLVSARGSNARPSIRAGRPSSGVSFIFIIFLCLPLTGA